jgi:AraC-like DNA-binding protein
MALIVTTAIDKEPRMILEKVLYPTEARELHQQLSPTQRLFASAHEDMARLTDILHSQKCVVAMRGSDGVVLPLYAAAAGPIDEATAALIYDAEGDSLASLGIIQGTTDRADTLLRALLESAARAITERWFRLTHGRDWLIAAMPRNVPGSPVLLAVDRDQRLLGADRQGRQYLQVRGRRWDAQLELSAFFRSNPALFRRRGQCDVPVTLLAASDAEPWIAVITPPNIGAISPSHDARAVLHARPRLDLLTHLKAMSSESREPRGLSRYALNRIEEYIDSHLDSQLDVQELAAVVRMSPSHFTRCFYKSVGLTPHKYVVQCRVMRARELLSTNDLPLTEIALTSGFADQSHFSRRFHELIGVPPGAFRCA